MAKSTIAEVDDRITEVMELVFAKKDRIEIVQYCAKKWNIGDRQADNYIRRARQIIQDEYVDKYREAIVYKSVKRMEDLYKQNYGNEDFAECLRVISKQNEILGTTIKKVDHTTKGEAMKAPIIMIYPDDE